MKLKRAGNDFKTHQTSTESTGNQKNRILQTPEKPFLQCPFEIKTPLE